MIEYLKTTSDGLKEFKKPTKNTWINLVNPDDKEIILLSKIIGIKEIDFDDFINDIQSLSDKEEIPMYEKKDNGDLFLIIRTPQESTGTSGQDYITIPLGIILTKNYVATVCYSKNTVVERMKAKKFKFNETYFILRLMLASSKSYLYFLKEIDRRLKKLEHKLEESQKNTEMVDLLDIQKSLVYFNTSLINNQILFEKISRSKIFILNEDNEDIVDDLLDENRQAIQTTQIYSDNITHTLSVLSSMISNNLNRTVKFLTSLSIIVAIPTIIASLYGMNIGLPFQEQKYAFWIVIFLCITFSTLIGVFLYRKKLF